MRGLTTLTAILLAFAASACGSDPAAGPAPQQAVVLAASKTNDAGTYKVDLSSTIEIAGATFQMSGPGEFDGDAQRGHVSYAATWAGQDFDLEMVYAFPVVYMRYPADLLPIPGGKSWVKVDLEQLGKPVGLDMGQLIQAGQSDPSQGLQYLRGVTDIRAVGEEEVRGVPTTHYSGVVDMRRLADEEPVMKETLNELVSRLGISRVPVDVWVDQNNFVRRLRESYEGAQSGVGMQMTMTTTTEFYDFGTDVVVEEPPPSDVVDLETLLGQS